jgi:hypothetical protein
MNRVKELRGNTEQELIENQTGKLGVITCDDKTMRIWSLVSNVTESAYEILKTRLNDKGITDEDGFWGVAEEDILQ